MPTLDPVSVFVTAEQFRFASKWLIRARGMGGEADVGIPAVTCAAMALDTARLSVSGPTAVKTRPRVRQAGAARRSPR
jgi:hypothetical protein